MADRLTPSPVAPRPGERVETTTRRELIRMLDDLDPRDSDGPWPVDRATLEALLEAAHSHLACDEDEEIKRAPLIAESPAMYALAEELAREQCTMERCASCNAIDLADIHHDDERADCHQYVPGPRCGNCLPCKAREITARVSGEEG